ncbi:MAG: hypothetical protein ACRD4Y_15700, partial [Candidatus Acidiferrales bacterium]
LLGSALASTFLATGCVQPLGSGFHFPSRRTEIRAAADSPYKLHVRVVDRLENAGNRELESLEVRLPESPIFGSQNLRVFVDGKEITPERGSVLDRRMMRAAFDPIWKQKQTREVITEWDLVPDSAARGSVAIFPLGFYVADETVLPLWQTPPGLFSVGEANPQREVLTVIAPSDFRVLAPGKLRKSRKIPAGNFVQREFQIRPDRDFLPYVVAGRYQEQVVKERQGDISFWTFRPLDSQATNTAAARLASSMSALSDFFGPPSKGKMEIHVVESPGELLSQFSAADEPSPDGRPANPLPGGTSFPNGVLLNARAIAQGVADETVLQLAEYELTRTWFGWRVRPTPEAQILMGRGVGLFGLVVAAEARGPQQRRNMIASLLKRYDAARAVAPDQRLMVPPFGYSRAERISSGYRAALFLVDLEDLCGHNNLRSAFREIIHARTGVETSYEDLRSAVESASKRNLAELFREWLIRPGVPEEFRNRYATP